MRTWLTLASDEDTNVYAWVELEDKRMLALLKKGGYLVVTYGANDLMESLEKHKEWEEL